MRSSSLFAYFKGFLQHFDVDLAVLEGLARFDVGDGYYCWGKKIGVYLVEVVVCFFKYFDERFSV